MLLYHHLVQNLAGAILFLPLVLTAGDDATLSTLGERTSRLRLLRLCAGDEAIGLSSFAVMMLVGAIASDMSLAAPCSGDPDPSPWSLSRVEALSSEYPSATLSPEPSYHTLASAESSPLISSSCFCFFCASARSAAVGGRGTALLGETTGPLLTRGACGLVIFRD